jgi:hypothetical protein
MRTTLAAVAVLAILSAVVYAQESSSKPQAVPKAKSQTAKPGGTTRPEPKVSVRGWKTYCSEEGAYCISYPPTWNVAGDVFEGTGVVVAPPQPGKEKSQWDTVTSSVAFVPEQQGNKEPPTFDEILTVAISSLPGKNVQTLHRTELTIAERPAQLVKLQYDDAETRKPWIEEIVFIDDGDAIYSTALRCAPEDLEKLEPTFRTMVATWRPSEEAPAVPEQPETKSVPKTNPPATKVPR